MSDVSFDYNYIEELRRNVDENNEEVSLEGFVDTLKKIIPNAVKNFLGFSKSLDIRSKAVTFNSREINKILKKSQGSNYLDRSDSLVYIPPHYTGTYLQYCELLDKFADYSNSLIGNMNFFEENLGYILSNENGKLKDFSKDITEYNQWRVERENLKKELASLFTGKSTSDKTTYDQVIKRNSDFVDIAKYIDTIQEKISKIDVKKVKENINLLSSHLTDIKKMLDEKKIDDASKDIGRNIAIGTLEIAEQIEFYSLLRFQYDILTTAIFDSLDMID